MMITGTNLVARTTQIIMEAFLNIGLDFALVLPVRAMKIALAVASAPLIPSGPKPAI